MKKYIAIFSIGLAFAAFISCEKQVEVSNPDDTDVTVNDGSGLVPLTFKASIEDITKADIGGGFILWESTDKIAVFDGTTTFTAVLATFNNIGPGLSMVGPTQNYGFFSNFSKCVLMFDMLAGRLELFPLLILLHPAAWKEFLQKQTVIRERRWNKLVHKDKESETDASGHIK